MHTMHMHAPYLWHEMLPICANAMTMNRVVAIKMAPKIVIIFQSFIWFTSDITIVMRVVYWLAETTMKQS